MPENYFEFLNRHVKVSHETFDRLSIYHDLLTKWQSKINLVSDDTLPDSWNRHFLDSLQLIPHLPSLDKPMVDLGSGAGFPGMVLAIYGAPHIHLVESDVKKISFLQEVARLTKTTVSLHHQRIEDLNMEEGQGIKAEIILARALADLNQLLKYAAQFVSHETICLFHKGKNYSKEIEDAKKYWSFDHAIIPSVTDQQGVIIRLSNLSQRAVYDGKRS